MIAIRPVFFAGWFHSGAGWESTTTSKVALLLLLAIPLGACETRRDGTGATVVVTDSAGVKIIAAPYDINGALEIEMTAQPQVELAAPSMGGTNVSRGIILKSGRTAVDNFRRELFWYDPSGTLIKLIDLSARRDTERARVDEMLRYRGDSVAVFDGGRKRVLMYDNLGNHGRSAQFVVDENRSLTLVGSLENGGFVTRWSERLTSPSPGLTNPVEEVVLHDEFGRIERLLATVPGRQLFFYERERGMGFALPPFAAVPQYIARGGRVYLSEGKIFEVRVLSTSGSLLEVLRLGRQPQAVTQDMRQRVVERRLANVRTSKVKKIAEEVLTRMMKNPTVPSITGLRVAGESTFWIRPGQDDAVASPSWDVFRTGIHIASVEMPRGWHLLDVSGNRALVLENGPRNTDIVRIFTLDVLENGPQGETRLPIP